MTLVADMTTPQGVTPRASKETADAPRVNLHDGISRSQGGGGVTVRELFHPPHPCDSLEAYEKLRHLDLGGLSHVELLLERDRIRWCLLVLDEDRRPGVADWLMERLAEVEGRLR